MDGRGVSGALVSSFNRRKIMQDNVLRAALNNRMKNRITRRIDIH